MGICCFNMKITRLNLQLCNAEPLQTRACSKQGCDQTVPLSTALLQVLAAAAPCSAAVLRMFAIFNVAQAEKNIPTSIITGRWFVRFFVSVSQLAVKNE